MPSNLDSFVTHSLPPPTALVYSPKIQDRGSTFEGVIYRIDSPSAAERIRSHHGQVVHAGLEATHEMAAWRCMSLKPRCSGLGGPDDFALTQGSQDDGETGGGRAILRVMEKEGVLDAVVIVSRWYGGQLLGPVRFTHIENCTREVCRAFKEMEEVEEIIGALHTFDEELAQLRAELATLTSTNEPSSGEINSSQGSDPRSIEYEKMLLSPPDAAKARRLLTARRNAINGVKGILARSKTKSAASNEPGSTIVLCTLNIN